MKSNFESDKRSFESTIFQQMATIINGTMKENWLHEKNSSHLNIEILSLKELGKNEINFKKDPLDRIIINKQTYFFGPNPIESFMPIKLENERCKSFYYVHEKSLSTKRLDDFRFFFYLHFQIFLQNSGRKSNKEAYMNNLQYNNPIIFCLLKDHQEEWYKELHDFNWIPQAQHISSIKTLQKQLERYFKQKSLPSSRNEIFSRFLDDPE